MKILLYRIQLQHTIFYRGLINFLNFRKQLVFAIWNIHMRGLFIYSFKSVISLLLLHLLHIFNKIQCYILFLKRTQLFIVEGKNHSHNIIPASLHIRIFFIQTNVFVWIFGIADRNSKFVIVLLPPILFGRFCRLKKILCFIDFYNHYLPYHRTFRSSLVKNISVCLSRKL